MKHIPTIRIKVIPHSEQAYDTPGNYWETKNGNWEVRISQMNPVSELAVLEHELYEMVKTILDGVKWSDIDKFDMGEGKDMDDPGSSPKAPYHAQHMEALKIERQIIKNVKGDWNRYDQGFSKLKYK